MEKIENLSDNKSTKTIPLEELKMLDDKKKGHARKWLIDFRIKNYYNFYFILKKKF